MTEPSAGHSSQIACSDQARFGVLRVCLTQIYSLLKVNQVSPPWQFLNPYRVEISELQALLSGLIWRSQGPFEAYLTLG